MLRNHDLIDLTATGLTWALLDTNGDGLLDDGDASISVGEFSTQGGASNDTVLDLGAATGGAPNAAITVAGSWGWWSPISSSREALWQPALCVPAAARAPWTPVASRAALK